VPFAVALNLGAALLFSCCGRRKSAARERLSQYFPSIFAVTLNQESRKCISLLQEKGGMREEREALFKGLISPDRKYSGLLPGT
jgi:hypothetical protein